MASREIRPRGRRAGQAKSKKPAPPAGVSSSPANQSKRGFARAQAARSAQVMSARLLDAAQVQKIADTEPVHVELPNLDGISIRVAPPEPITSEQIDASLDAIVTAAAGMIVRPEDAPVEMGDQIFANVTGFVGGEVISAQEEVWLDMAPNEMLPGLFENLAGQLVGDGAVINVDLPDNYPDPDRAGQTAVFSVDILMARAPAPKPDVLDVLDELGYGRDMDVAREKLREDLEHQQAELMVSEAKERLLDAIYERSNVQIPDSVIDAYLQREWRDGEGANYARAGVDLEAQKGGMEVFLRDENERARVARDIWQVHLLDRVADEAGIEVDEAELVAVMTKAASASGLRGTDVRAALGRAPKAHMDELLARLRRDRALDTIIERSEIQFG